MSALELLRARTALRAQMASMLAGHGLEIRDLARDIVITNPRDPEKGRVYVGCSDGEVSWKRTVWDHFGPLAGPDAEASPQDIAGKIIAALAPGTQGRPQ
ncbi:MAG TPA: hypothetical protein VGL63_02675 [Streptosporangiaceae bacterium]